MRQAGLPALVLAVSTLAACSGGADRLFKQYEYEEEIFLDIDGSATVIVNASIPALVALRGLDLDPNPRARVDRARIRAQFQTPETPVARVSRPWRRSGRRFVQVRLEVDDVRRLSRSAPFGWASYRLDREGDEFAYRQRISDVAGAATGDFGWDGSELVAVRLHVPSRITYHNAPSRRVDRGNIVAWEQALSERRAGAPLDIEVRMETASILQTTLWLFGLAFASAMAVLAGVIAWVVRKRPAGERERKEGSGLKA
jgi:hypothetical protein